MKRPTVRFSSSGPSGNVFHILALVREALRKQHRITDYNELRDRVIESKSYRDALAEIRKDVDLIDEDGVY